jgi:hypothetical protein
MSKLPQRLSTLALLAAPALLIALAPGCGSKHEEYKAKPAFSGKPATLPPVPTLPKKPKKEGDAYTVSGAIHDMRSRVHAKQILDKEITLVGYIVKTNLDEAPACAVHKTGTKDGKECETKPPPYPEFWIADDKGTPVKDAIEVMGWASNYAKIFDAITKYKAPNNKEAAKDDSLGLDMPMPLPAKDAKVKVTGTYSTTFTKGQGGTASNPLTGILTFKKIEFVEPPPTPATLPGMK